MINFGYRVIIFYALIAIMSGTKITEVLNNKSRVSFSVEVTPQFNLGELDNLAKHPDFIAVTWHAKSYEFKSMDIPPLKLAKSLKEKGFEVILHLSCDLLNRDYLDQVLEYLQRENITNIFAVLGENYNASQSYFQSTKDLISYIRQKTGDYFCIGVAGFPGGSERKFQHLKEKVDSGANFILTQAFFELSVYEDFMNVCKTKDINAPVMPGLYLFDTKQQLNFFIDLCKLKTSNSLMNDIESIGDNNGRDVIKNLVKDIIITKQYSGHVHFFTLNNVKKVVEFIRDLESNKVV